MRPQQSRHRQFAEQLNVGGGRNRLKFARYGAVSASRSSTVRLNTSSLRSLAPRPANRQWLGRTIRAVSHDRPSHELCRPQGFVVEVVK